jgi:cation transport regulator ChaB
LIQIKEIAPDRSKLTIIRRIVSSREASNHAFATHVGDPRQEERAHRIAWAGVKRSYVKVGGSWIGRTGRN